MQIYRQSSAKIGLSVVIDGTLTDADVVDDVHQVFATVTLLPSTVLIPTQAAAHDGTGLYSISLDPLKTNDIGKCKVEWTYRVNGITYTRTSFFDIVIPYVTAGTFKSQFPEFSSKTDDEIYRKEHLARKIIDTFCNQSFDYRLDKTYKIRGSDSDFLHLPDKIISVISVKVEGTDITSSVEVAGDYLLRSISQDDPDDIFAFSFFRKDSIYEVRGNWGWDYVPDEIEQACMLLIKDYFTDDYILRQHSIMRASFGDENYQFSEALMATGTGNIDVDNLLSNYVRHRMWMI